MGEERKAAAMPNRAKLTKAGRELLRLLARGERYDITDESVVKALARRGLAERAGGRMGHLTVRHYWAITDKGRAALSETRDG